MNVHRKLNTTGVACFCSQSMQVNRMSADFFGDQQKRMWAKRPQGPRVCEKS